MTKKYLPICNDVSAILGMANFSLYDRFTTDGTLSEPTGIPDPRYALPSTVHWMQALRMLVETSKLDFEKAKQHYGAVQKGALSPQAENTVFEHLMLALHQLAALKALLGCDPQADVARVASVGWYYGIYDAATAMVAAQSGDLQDNHTKTARSWDNQFAMRGLAMYPFDLRLSTLVEKDAEVQLQSLRRIGKTTLVNEPVSEDQAHDYACAYLSGTRKWSAWKAEEDLKTSNAFKALGVGNFRTSAARTMRDNRLRGQAISFLHLAFRYRGKANYREALYLAHGASVEATILNFIRDMTVVLEAFLAMAGAFSRRRLGKNLWNEFTEDVERNRSFSVSPKEIWK